MLQPGEGLAFAKRTLPRKKPNTIDRIIHIFASMVTFAAGIVLIAMLSLIPATVNIQITTN